MEAGNVSLTLSQCVSNVRRESPLMSEECVCQACVALTNSSVAEAGAGSFWAACGVCVCGMGEERKEKMVVMEGSGASMAGNGSIGSNDSVQGETDGRTAADGGRTGDGGRDGGRTAAQAFHHAEK